MLTMRRNVHSFRCGTAPVGHKPRHSAIAVPCSIDHGTTKKSASFNSFAHQQHSSSSPSLGGMSPRVMEQISAVQANKIFVDDERNVPPPLSAPIRLRKAFWAEDDSSTSSLDGDTETDVGDQPASKYTIPPAKMLARRSARRRRHDISPLILAKRPPSRQITAFPVNLGSMRRELTRAGTAKINRAYSLSASPMRSLLSDKDRHDHMSPDVLDSSIPARMPSSPIHRPSPARRNANFLSGQTHIPKAGFERPPSREKTHALFLDLPAAKTEIGDRLALSDRTGVTNHKNVWVDPPTSRSASMTPRPVDLSSSSSTESLPELALNSGQKLFSSSACENFVGLFAD